MAERPTFPASRSSHRIFIPVFVHTPFRGSAETVFVMVATTSFRDLFRSQQSEPFVSSKSFARLSGHYIYGCCLVFWRYGGLAMLDRDRSRRLFIPACDIVSCKFGFEVLLFVQLVCAIIYFYLFFSLNVKNLNSTNIVWKLQRGFRLLFRLRLLRFVCIDFSRGRMHSCA